MSIVKPDDVGIVWASGANPADVVNPDTIIAGKTVLGWLGTDIPPHTFFNYQMNKVAAFIGHVNERGVALWDAVTDYPVNARVQGSDGVLYKGKVTPNVNNNPTGGANPTQWLAEVLPEKATGAEGITGTDNDKYMTPFATQQTIASHALPSTVRVPTNVTPADVATGVTNPTLVGNAFGALYGILQKSAQFKVATDVGMTVIVYDSGEIGATTSHTVPSGILSGNTQYFWQVRYRSVDDVWSGYSVVTSFTTAAVLIFIAQPSITFPTVGLTGVSRTPTLTGSAFSVSGGSDTHLTSRWQISTNASFSNIVYDSGQTTDLVSHTVPEAEALDALINYYVRVSYQGLTLGSSSFSGGVNFTTTNLFFNWATYSAANNGVIANVVTTAAAGAPFNNNLLGVFGSIGYSILKVASDGITLTKLGGSGFAFHGLFPKINAFYLQGNTATERKLRVYEDNGINFKDVVTSNTISSTFRQFPNSYVQYNDSICYYVNTSNQLVGSSLNAAGDDVVQTTFDSSVGGVKTVALTRDKNFLITSAVTSIDVEYKINSFNAGSTTSVVLSTLLRTVGHTTDTIRHFCFDNGIVVVLHASGTNLFADSHSISASGIITQLTVDTLIASNFSMSVASSFSVLQVDTNLGLIVFDGKVVIISHNASTNTITVENTELLSGLGHDGLFSIAGGTVYRQFDVDEAQILDARL